MLLLEPLEIDSFKFPIRDIALLTELPLSWTVHCFWTMGCMEHCGIVGEILGGVKSKSSGLRDG